MRLFVLFVLISYKIILVLLIVRDGQSLSRFMQLTIAHLPYFAFEFSFPLIYFALTSNYITNNYRRRYFWEGASNLRKLFTLFLTIYQPCFSSRQSNISTWSSGHRLTSQKRGSITLKEIIFKFQQFSIQATSLTPLYQLGWWQSRHPPPRARRSRMSC